MRTGLVIVGLILSLHSYGQLWTETFNGLANGSVSDAGATSWTTILPSGGAASFSKQTPVGGYELFVVNDTGTEGVWQSGIVDISSYTEVAIEITLYSNFTFSSDYIRCYYKVDGNPEVQFGELTGSNGLNITSAASAIVSGSTLQIVVRASDNTPGSTSGIINALAFDDITLTSIRVLYSRSSGNWNNNNTWSDAGFGGTSCGCTPNANSRVVIGNNRNVTIPAAATTAGIAIESTGRLQFTGNTTLTLARGATLAIAQGGVLNNNGNNATIIYGAYAYNVIADGTLTITDIDANRGGKYFFFREWFCTGGRRFFNREW